MTVTTESGGRQNAFPNETRPYIDESVSYDGYPQNAEKVNGRLGMIGFVALICAYATTGQIIPGIFLWIDIIPIGDMLKRSMVVLRCLV